MNHNPRHIPIYSNGQYPDSYYAASRNDHTEYPTLQNDMTAEICVVGGGYSGLSTAIHLLELGHEVVLLEGARIGWGASGRNGGQIVNGLNAGLDKIQKAYGADTAAFVGGLITRGNDIIRRVIADYHIECDLKNGNIYVGHTEAHMQGLRNKKALWSQYGMDSHEILDRTALKQYINSNAYLGGMIDHSGGHMHPLNLALGEARALTQLGGKIFEHTLVTEVTPAQDHVLVLTDQGSVRAQQVVLCGNAYLDKAVPTLRDRVMPASTQIVATEPLGDLANELMPGGACVEDVRYILDYYRISADGRLLFGGGTVYGGTDPADIEAKIRPNMEKVFPQTQGVNIDYAWSGNFAISFSRVPQMGEIHPRIKFAHGYSGHGVTGSHLFGQILANAIHGNTTEYERFKAIPWLPFPGGRALRVPYSMIGSWWYGLRDRLGM